MITFRKIKFDPPIEPTDSRFNAGILYLPKEFIDSKTENGTPEERDDFLDELIREMSKPFDGSVLPLIPLIVIGKPDDGHSGTSTEVEN